MLDCMELSEKMSWLTRFYGFKLKINLRLLLLFSQVFLKYVDHNLYFLYSDTGGIPFTQL